MATVVITDFGEKSIILDKNRRLQVDDFVAVTDDVVFNIPQPAERTETASVTGFRVDTTGDTIAITNFYSGSVDRVRVTNQIGRRIVVCSLSDTGRINSIPEIA